jgi:hypothetical protein
MLRFVLAVFLFSPTFAFAASEPQELSTCVIKNACAIKTGKPTADNINSAFQKCAAGKDGASIDTTYWQSQSLLGIETKSGAMLFNLTCTGYDALKTKDENCVGAKDGGLEAKKAGLNFTQDILQNLFQTKGEDGLRCASKNEKGETVHRAGYVSDGNGGCSRICPQDKLITMDSVTNQPQCTSCRDGYTLSSKGNWCEPPKCDGELFYDPAQQTCVLCPKGTVLDAASHKCKSNGDCSAWEEAGRKYEQTERELQSLKSSLPKDFKYLSCSAEKLKTVIDSYMSTVSSMYSLLFSSEAKGTPSLNQCNVPDAFKTSATESLGFGFGVSGLDYATFQSIVQSSCNMGQTRDTSPIPSLLSSISFPFIAAPPPIELMDTYPDD